MNPKTIYDLRMTLIYEDKVNPCRKVFIKLGCIDGYWTIRYPKKYRKDSSQTKMSFWNTITDVLVSENIECGLFRYKNIGAWK